MPRPRVPPAFCRGEAAAKFSLSPRQISTLPVERVGPAASADDDDIVTVTEMPRFCKGMAAEKFEVKPGRITTNKALKEADGRYRVFGQYITPVNDVQVFHCKFSPSGKFLNVKTDNR